MKNPFMRLIPPTSFEKSSPLAQHTTKHRGKLATRKVPTAQKMPLFGRKLHVRSGPGHLERPD